MGGVPSKAEPGRQLEVISAGFSRTGTVSMQIALERLLGGPAMHGGSHVLARDEAYLRKFAAAVYAKRDGDKETCLKNLRVVFDGFVACSDIPTNLFVPELLEIYPDAKVVLVSRDPERWWKSLQGIMTYADASIIPILTCIAPRLRWYPVFLEAWRRDVDKLMVGIGKAPGEYGPDLLEAHNAYIRSVVPKDKLLEMQLSDGWEPLCKFLGKPIPDEPFPRVNDADVSDRVGKQIFLKLMLMWAGVFGIVGYGAYAIRNLVFA